MPNLENSNEKSLLNGNNVYKSSFKSMSELAEEGRNQKPLAKVFGNYILANNFVNFVSERGVGKTWYELQLCLAISSRQDSFCNEPLEFHGNTILINCELSEYIMKQRLTKLFQNPPFKINQSEFQAYVYTTRHSWDVELKKIKELIEKYKPVVVFLDNFRMAFLQADSSNNRDVAQIMNQLLILKDTYNLALVVTDHTKKNTRTLLTESDLQTGAGAKSDLADGDMFLRKSSQNQSYRVLKRAKSRNCEEQQGAKLLLFNQETLWFEFLADGINEEDHLGNGVITQTEDKIELAKELKDKGRSYDQIAQLLNVSKSMAYRWLNN
jgi:hypothetical protein